MKRSFRQSFGLLVVVMALLASPARAQEQMFEFDGRTLTVRTERFELKWQDGGIVELTTHLPETRVLTRRSNEDGADESAIPDPAAHLPRGLGSFAHAPDKAHGQHIPWAARPTNTYFAAQHAPTEETSVAYERTADGARLTYRGLRDEPDAALVQHLSVDPDTGDLVIRQRVRDAEPGAFGIAFTLSNLRRDIDLLVPYFGGQRWDEDFRPQRITTIGWPQFWNVGLVVGELEDAPEATFAVWAEDAELRPKFLHWYNHPRTQGMAFEACVEPPYEQRRDLGVTEWRLNTFAGSWQAPAERYKQWMSEAHNLRPRAEDAAPWVRNIGLVWPHHFSRSDMETLAEAIDPRHVLVMNFGALKGFNRRIPEYDFGDGFADAIAAAHELGYHVGVYTSMALIDQETHPDVMERYGLDYVRHALYREQPPSRDSWLAYVHPGSDDWRRFYTDTMARIVENYGVDYLYQDVTSITAGGSGVIDGRNFHQGVIASERAIRERLPDVSLGGEFWSEVSAIGEDFATQQYLGWGGGGHAKQISAPGRPHPIASYILSDYCLYFDHRVPTRSEKFHPLMNINEVIGALPTWRTDATDRVSNARVLLKRARLFADGYRPWFPEQWDKQAVSYMRNDRGELVRYDRIDGSTYCYRLPEASGDERLHYARVTGQRRVRLEEPVVIDGWLAYDEAGPIGLNPERWYCVFPGNPAEQARPVTVTRLPKEAWLNARAGSDHLLLEVGGEATGSLAWETNETVRRVEGPRGPMEAAAGRVTVETPTSLLFVLDEPRRPGLEQALALDQWDHRIVQDGAVLREAEAATPASQSFDGLRLRAFRAMPPLGGEGSERSIDGLVTLPEAEDLALRAHLGRYGGRGDGVHFVVRVNGKEVWRQFSESERGWTEVTVPLDDHAGRTVLLSLAVDCGPSGHNTSNDQALWGAPRFVTRSASDGEQP
ncbi:MAG: DUF6259 domain-containing protein [Phycisphaeraceae bacterium]